MENSPEPRKGSPILEMMLAVLCILILVIFLVPINTGDRFYKGKLTTALSNGRQIHQAASRMALDSTGVVNPHPDLGWPGDLAKAPHPFSAGHYVERLVEYKYLDRESLAKLFAGPGVVPYGGTDPFEGKHSVFNFYKIQESDLDEALFLATKNFTYGSGLDEKKPYGDKGAVVVRKGGDAQTLSASGASNRNIGVMPGGTKENPGEQNGNMLIDY